MNASLRDRIANLSIFTKFFLLIGAVILINNLITFLGIYVTIAEAFSASLPIKSVMSGTGEYDTYLPNAISPTDGLLTSLLPYIARGFISLVGSLEWLGLAYIIELYFRIADKMSAYMRSRVTRKLAK